VIRRSVSIALRLHQSVKCFEIRWINRDIEFPEYSGFSSGKGVVVQDAVDQISGWEQPLGGENLDRSNEIPGRVLFEQAEKGEKLSRVVEIVVMIELLDRGMQPFEDQGIGERTGFVLERFKIMADVQ
jgi:hypothetical protein